MEEEFFKGKERDKLTNIYTRDVIVEYVSNLIKNGTPFSIALIDIDNFKYVNDTYGHIVGDKVIRTVADKISGTIKDFGFMGRYGGDEFILVIPNVVEYDAVWTACRSISLTMKNFEMTEVPGLLITVTVGLARYPENETTYEKLFETADKALYRGKMKGRNCFIIYLPEKHSKIVLKTEKEKVMSSMNLHSIVYKYLTNDTNLAENIRNVFGWMSSYFMFDHICIQNNNNIYFQKVNELSDCKNFDKFDENFIPEMSMSTGGFFYINNRDQLKKMNMNNYYDMLEKQKISSTFCCELKCQNKLFGYLRVDSVHQRIWQHTDMDILISVAQLLSLILFDHNLTLENL